MLTLNTFESVWLKIDTGLYLPKIKAMIAAVRDKMITIGRTIAYAGTPAMHENK